jgi:hypothetical protein
LYDAAPADERRGFGVDDAASQRVTIQADGSPASHVLEAIALQTSSNIAWSPTVDAVPVTLTLTDAPLASALEAIARRAGTDVVPLEGIYYLGQTASSDRSHLVRRVGDLDPDDVVAMVTPLLTDEGKASITRDGLLLVADRSAVLPKVVAALDALQSAPPSVWVVQFWLLDHGAARDAGVEVSHDVTAELAAGYQTAGFGDAKLVARASFRAIFEDSSNVVSAGPLLHLVAGQPTIVERTERVPVPRKTVTENGATVTNGYDTIAAGLKISAEVREGDRVAELRYTVELSGITGYVEGAPVITGQTIEGTTLCVPGGTYLIARLDRTQDERRRFPFGIPQRETVRSQVTTLWATLERVSGPVRGEVQEVEVTEG